MKRKAIQSIDMFSRDSSMDEAIRLANEATDKLSSISNPYIGNKKKLLINIASHLVENNILPFSNKSLCLDLFGGSGSVSYLLKKLGSSVIYNDILTSSCISAIANIENEAMSIDSSVFNSLVREKNTSKRSFIKENYCKDIHNPYRFSERESDILDNFYQNCLDYFSISNIGEYIYGRNVTDEKSIKVSICVSTMLSYIMDRCQIGGRLNHGQVVADFEHRVSHPRNKNKEMFFSISPRSIGFSNERYCKVYNKDAYSALDEFSGSVDFAYIDPPYGGDQSDYTNMYSFCEEYIWQRKIEEVPLFRDSRKFIKSKDYDAGFNNLICFCRNIRNLLISYNDSSWANIDHIEKIIKNHRENVRIIPIKYEYKQRKVQDSSTEYLIFVS